MNRRRCLFRVIVVLYSKINDMIREGLKYGSFQYKSSFPG